MSWSQKHSTKSNCVKPPLQASFWWLALSKVSTCKSSFSIQTLQHGAAGTGDCKIAVPTSLPATLALLPVATQSHACLPFLFCQVHAHYFRFSSTPPAFFFLQSPRLHFPRLLRFLYASPITSCIPPAFRVTFSVWLHMGVQAGVMILFTDRPSSDPPL